MTPSQIPEFFLTKVSYSEAHREIIAEFENSSQKSIERFKLFPKAFIKAGGNEENAIKEILGLYGRKKFSLSRKSPEVLELEASTFTDLKKILNLLQQSLRKGFNIIEPERQFLILKNWSYFEAFKKTEFGFEKLDAARKFPELSLEGSGESIRSTTRQLLKHDGKSAGAFLKNIAFSRILKIPARFAPESIKEAGEKFLENSLFKNSFIIEKSKEKRLMAFEKSASGFFENVSEIDFTPVWAGLLSSQEFNLGFETINCECCIPKGFNAENILPNSKIEVQFLQNGFYFESASQEFALEFHNSKSESKNARIQRMNDWFLKTIPTGPFNNGEKCLVPLPDAVQLQMQEKAIILENSELKWFCARKQSFLSQEIMALILEITQFEDKLVAWEQSALSTHKVLCSTQLSELPEYLLDYYSKKTIEELLRQVLEELNCKSSRFWQKSLAESLNALQSAKISEFKQLAKANGEKILQSNGMEVLIKAEKPTILLKEFARKSRTAIPSIRKNFKELVLS